MITTLMLTLNYRVDTLMMGYLYHIPDTEIGFYSLGVSLSEYGWLIPDAFREVLFSRTAKDDAIEEVTMSMKVNFYLTLLMILGILLLGVIAFCLGTAGGVLLAKLMNVFSKEGNKINPLIGSAGVSAVPMAARVSQIEGQKADPSNFLLMHAMGPNVAGVVGSAVAAGILLSFLG